VVGGAGLEAQIICFIEVNQMDFDTSSVTRLNHLRESLPLAQLETFGLVHVELEEISSKEFHLTRLSFEQWEAQISLNES